MLHINMSYWADIFAQNPGEDMAVLRHAAYRQFVLWRHDRLGTETVTIFMTTYLFYNCDMFSIRKSYMAYISTMYSVCIEDIVDHGPLNRICFGV